MAIPAPKPNIDTCHHCGKLFPRVNVRLCGTCAPIEEHRFRLVRSYVHDHDGAPVGEIARMTGVSAADVHHWVDVGRLVLTGPELEGCTCSEVSLGERCRYCRAQLTSTFRDTEAEMKRKAAERRSDDESHRISYVRRIRRVGE